MNASFEKHGTVKFEVQMTVDRIESNFMTIEKVRNNKSMMKSQKHSMHLGLKCIESHEPEYVYPTPEEMRQLDSQFENISSGECHTASHGPLYFENLLHCGQEEEKEASYAIFDKREQIQIPSQLNQENKIIPSKCNDEMYGSKWSAYATRQCSVPSLQKKSIIESLVKKTHEGRARKREEKNSVAVECLGCKITLHVCKYQVASVVFCPICRVLTPLVRMSERSI